MCLACRPITARDVSWDGDLIIRETALPASRPIPGARAVAYDIDVREYLAWERNAVIRGVLEREIASTAPERFTASARGDFDFRARAVLAFVSRAIRYEPVRKKSSDPWRFPDETLRLRKGDCEDRAFALAALLLAAGVSPYNVRVALGRVTIFDRRGRASTHDHMWVMYKNEAGFWLSLEPTPRKPGGAPELVYQPEFLFNGDHLWAVRGSRAGRDFADAARVRRDWRKLRPTFEGSVHQSVMELAVGPLLGGDDRLAVLEAFARQAVLVTELGTVDSLDNPAIPYDPADHFDDAFIDDGWDLVQQRLELFQASQDAADFVPAAHGIADFYAHSSYLHFAALRDDVDAAFAWAPRNPRWASAPRYDLASFTPHGGGFSINTAHTHVLLSNAGWDGRVISGRYGQPDDPYAGRLERISDAQIPDARLGAGVLEKIGSLPHHDEIAVDSLHPEPMHRLYGTSGPKRMTYLGQFTLRKNTAVLHVRQAFLDTWRGELSTFANGARALSEI